MLKEGISRVGQSAKTPPFHGGMTGSIPVRATRSPAEKRGFSASGAAFSPRGDNVSAVILNKHGQKHGQNVYEI